MVAGHKDLVPANRDCITHREWMVVAVPIFHPEIAGSTLLQIGKVSTITLMQGHFGVQKKAVRKYTHYNGISSGFLLNRMHNMFTQEGGADKAGHCLPVVVP